MLCEKEKYQRTQKFRRFFKQKVSISHVCVFQSKTKLFPVKFLGCLFDDVDVKHWNKKKLYNFSFPKDPHTSCDGDDDKYYLITFN